MGGQGGKKKAFKAAAKKQPAEKPAAKKPEMKAKPEAKAVAKKQPAKPAAPIAKKAAKKEAKTEAEEEEEVEQLAEELAEKAPAKAAPKKTKARRLEEALQAMENAPDEEEEEDDEDDEEEGEKEEADKAAGSGKGKKGKKKPKGEPRGVIYIGHLPRGFFEPQLRKFFSQFGKVTRLRLSRSKKNAQSKGYAFIEFAEEAVSTIVANTMTKYLLFGKQLVCHVVPSEKQHRALFKGSRSRMVNFTNRRRRQAREAYNKRPKLEVDGQTLPRTTVRQEGRRKKSEAKLNSLLSSLGVDYDTSMAAASYHEGGDTPAAGKKRKAADAVAASPKGGAAKAKAKAQGKKKKA